MQAGSACVEQDGHLILHQQKLHLVDGARLLEPGEVIPAAEPLDNRLFHDRLAGRHAGKPGVQASALHGERIRPADPFLPRKGAHTLKELLKREGTEAAELDLHALAVAAPEICAREQIVPAAEQHTAVLRLDVARLHGAELVSHKPLHAEQAGDGHLVFFHEILLSVPHSVLVGSGMISRSRSNRPITSR